MRQYMWKHLVLITDLLFVNQKLLVSIYCGPDAHIFTQLIKKKGIKTSSFIRC